MLDISTQRAVKILNAIDMTASAIQESTETGMKRADIVASYGDESYLIEVKTRLENEETARERAISFQKNIHLTSIDPFQNSQEHGRKNSFEAMLKQARKQLVNTRKSDEQYCVVWLNVQGVDSDLKASQAQATFYGMAHLNPHCTNAEEIEPVICYYFDFSSAKRFPELDAVIIEDSEGAYLCLNEFSLNYARFKSSYLFKYFKNAVVDPLRYSMQGTTIALRSDISRTNEDNVLAAIHDQTGHLYYRCRLVRHSAEIAIPFRRNGID